MTPTTHSYSNNLHPNTETTILPDIQQVMAIADTAEKHDGPVLWITPSSESAQKIHSLLHFFARKDTTVLFPGWGLLPYDCFSASKQLISERLASLYHITQLKKGIILSDIPTLLHKICPKSYLLAHSCCVKTQQVLDSASFVETLTHLGYQSVETVREHRQFSVRGAIIDLFPMGSKWPIRIERYDNAIENLRFFNPKTQASIQAVSHINILPAREFPLTADSVKLFSANWQKYFPHLLDASLLKSIQTLEPSEGIEYYLPLFFEKMESIFEYIPHNTLLATGEDLKLSAQHFFDSVKKRQASAQVVDLPYALNFLSPKDFFAEKKRFQSLNLNTQSIKKTFSLHTLPPKKENCSLSTYLETQCHAPLQRILLSARSESTLQNYSETLKKKIPYAQDWQTFLASDTPIMCALTEIESGYTLSKLDITVVTETEYTPHYTPTLHTTRKKRNSLKKAPPSTATNPFDTPAAFTPGDLVVHVDYGIGRYQGIESLTVENQTADYVTLLYTNADKVYIPITSLNTLYPYCPTGSSTEEPPLSHLGSTKWKNTRNKVAQRIQDFAAKLLENYGKREIAQGFSFENPGKEFERFRAAFPFKETPDQEKTINEIIQDMIIPEPMNRLVCGDVGFGKTEVAMQAAFLAVLSGKQVLMLSPTTLLTTQHHKSFENRFANWPVRIAELSRLQKKQKQIEIINELKKGTIDIVISTHRALSADLCFKALGLLIIDEEHRFGVMQKEKIQSLQSNIDVLSLTATPIPRTLNLSLTGHRALSIIATPPKQRLPIKTLIHPYSTTLIQEAAHREFLRGGQLYFLHNKVDTIDQMLSTLQTLLPEARIAIAHGQMPKEELEQVMIDFHRKKHNILLCSTIIESGIDMPNANTIIINRAEKLGLAQMYQLRGRVGRAHQQAYAYLLTPEEAYLSSKAKKRLVALQSLNTLGAGFLLARHDLEIRGAGDFLGAAQSGQCNAVGFDLYMQMLNEAIAILKKPSDTSELGNVTIPEITYFASSRIPETYIQDVSTRFSFYKALSDSNTPKQVDTLDNAIEDRFGKKPESTQNLLTLTQFKVTILSIGVKKVDIRKKYIQLEWAEKNKIHFDRLIQTVQSAPKTYMLKPPNTLRINTPIENTLTETLTIARKCLEKITSLKI